MEFAPYLFMPTRTALVVISVWAVFLLGIVSGCDSSKRTAERHYQEGLRDKEKNEFSTAVKQFRLALKHNPQHAEAHLELGMLLCRDQQYRDAIKHLLRAVEYGDSSDKPYAFMGYAYERLGYFVHAVHSYKHALSLAPGLVDIRLRLAGIFEAKGKRLEAADMLQEVLTIKPDIDDAEMLKMRSSLLRQPESENVQYQLADLYIRYGQIRQGIREYRKFEVLDAEIPDSLLNFGLFCLEREQFSTAVTYLRQARQSGLTTPLEIPVGLGIAYEKLGEVEHAIEEYQAALRLQSDWYELYSRIAKLLEQDNKPAEAADTLGALLAVAKHSSGAHQEQSEPDIDQVWAEILRLRGESSRKAVVQLKRSDRYNELIDVIINQQFPATLLVEERAIYTILSERLAQTLGIQITSRTSEVHFEIGGKAYTAPLINLPSLKVGELEVRNIPTLVWNLSEYPGIDGFLGKSFLKHFQLDVKYDEQLVILTRKSSS